MLRNGFISPAHFALAIAVIPVAVCGIPADAAVDDFRTKMEKWVETRQILSEEVAEWEGERQMLRATRGLLATEKEALASEIQELEGTSTQADEERNQLLLERGEYQRANRALASETAALETNLKELVPRLPAPLQHKLQPLLVQVPDDPENTRAPLGQRLMNVLGVLMQAEKFNATATFSGETQALDEGVEVQVRTLYWGLSQAVYVDARGTTAGIGRPGTNGWEFSSEPSLADDAGMLLDIYEGNVDVIDFVELPAAVR